MGLIYEARDFMPEHSSSGRFQSLRPGGSSVTPPGQPPADCEFLFGLRMWVLHRAKSGQLVSAGIRSMQNLEPLDPIRALA